MAEYSRFEGVFSIAPTPFNKDGTLDLDSIKTLVDFYIAKGVHGLTILGVMGEADRLLPEERVRVIETFLSEVNGRMPVVIGTSHAGTIPAIALARQAERLGAAGVMVAPPPVAGGHQEQLLRDHFQAISDVISIPIVVQDYPPSSGVMLATALLSDLAETVEHVEYLKLEDPPTPVKIGEVRRLAGDRLSIFGGLGGVFYLEELERGASGTMTGFAYPEILVDIYNHYIQGKRERAAEIFYRSLPLIRFEFQPVIGLAVRKEVFRRRGAIKTASTRAPSFSLDKGTVHELTVLIARLGLG